MNNFSITANPGENSFTLSGSVTISTTEYNQLVRMSEDKLEITLKEAEILNNLFIRAALSEFSPSKTFNPIFGRVVIVRERKRGHNG